MDQCSIGGSVYHGYMCILLCVRLMGCNSFAWIYAQFGGPSAMGICAFCYTWNLLGVTVLHGSMVNLGVHQPWVYVHSAIWEMYWVYWCSINLWSIGGWSFCPGYMCILLCVKLLGFNSVAWIYGQFNGVHQPWVYVHSLICGTSWVYQCSLDLWSIGGCPSAMGICASCYTWNFLGLTV